MYESQGMRYHLSWRRNQRPAFHVRSRRIALICLAVLLYIPAVFISVNALITQAHWWGLEARPAGDPTNAWQITWVDPRADPSYHLNPGDHIVAADGQVPQSDEQINRANTLLVRPQGELDSHLIRWTPPDQLDNALSISWIVFGALSLLLGLLVYLHATERVLALRFFLLWTTLALVASLEPATVFGDLLATHLAHILAAGVFFGILTSFLWLLLFPARPQVVALPAATNQPATTGGPKARHRWSPEIPVVTGFLLAALYLSALTTHQLKLIRGIDILLYAQTALGICLSLFFILRVSISSQATVARERARTLLGGVLIGVMPLLLLTVIPTLVLNRELVPGTVSAIALIALPLSFAYAVVRRDLLRVDSLIRKTSLSLLTVIGLSIVAAVLAAALRELPVTLAIVLGISAGAILTPIIIAIARWLTEAWLFPQVRRYRQLIAAGEGIERTGLDPQRLAGQLAGEVHLALPVRQVAIFVPDKHTGRLVALPIPQGSTKPDDQATSPAVAKSATTGATSPFTAALPQHELVLDEAVIARLTSPSAGPVLVEPVPIQQAPSSTSSGVNEPAIKEDTQPDLESWHLLVPMRVRGRLVGILALSRREDEQAYSHTDIQLLRFLAGRRALALDYSLLYADLHLSFQKQQEVDRLKDQFILTAHHELRTPLTGIQGYLELLRSLGPEGRAARPKEVDIFIERACQAADELSEQLNSLLAAVETDFSQSQLRQQPIIVSNIAQRAIQTLDPLARRGTHRIRNQISPEIIVLGDEEALYRIFINLLSNAIKYSADGRPVVLDSQPPNKASRRVVWATPPATPGEGATAIDIIVRDWGQGIASRDQHKIFERFTRLERDLNSPIRGSGLGLAICKELVQAMGGNIGVESEGIPGAGSTFLLRLPLSSSAPNAQPGSPIETSSLQEAER